MSTKTFKVEDLKIRVNHFTLHTADENVEGRIAAASLLDSVLHSTGNYRGFNYLSHVDMEASDNGTVPGINVTREVGCESMTYDERFQDCDDSRRFYY